ncbi:MAG: SIMPL domain-containing protein [Planctomycetota bacterium]
MEYRIRTDLIRSAVVVALGVTASLIVSTAVAARAYRGRGEDVSRDRRTLSVKGLARKRIRSDVAVWEIEVKGEAAALEGAYDALESGMEQVLAFLNKRGFQETEVAFGAIRTETHYRHDAEGKQTRGVAAYTLRRELTVTSGEVERVAVTAGEVTRLIREGVLVVSSAPEFYYSRIADLKIELMGLASRDARTRAEEIASNAGSSVGTVRSARMGVLQITRPHSTEVSSYGIYDTDTIDKDVRAVVSVTFGVG